jgi:membrane protein DedA with SNARE-associated domain
VDFESYAILFLGVAASWSGIPIVGGAVLAAAGALVADGRLDVWLVIVVAAAAAWTGGYVGYVLGQRVGDMVAQREGRWQRQRQRAIRVGERFYRRWGPLAVFLTPTWVSGALRMPRNSFLAWNALAAIASNLVAVTGAYAIVGVLGRLSAGPGLAGLAAVVIATAAVGVVAWRRARFRQYDRPERPDRSAAGSGRLPRVRACRRWRFSPIRRAAGGAYRRPGRG